MLKENHAMLQEFESLMPSNELLESTFTLRDLASSEHFQTLGAYMRTMIISELVEGSNIGL
jgi:hypothetical protein